MRILGNDAEEHELGDEPDFEASADPVVLGVHGFVDGKEGEDDVEGTESTEDVFVELPVIGIGQIVVVEVVDYGDFHDLKGDQEGKLR